MDNSYSKKLVILDAGFIMHRAIFSYAACLEKEREKLMKSEEVDEPTAKRMLDIKLKNNIIFISKPPLTFMRMIVSYLKKIGIDSTSQIILAVDYGSWRKELDLSYKAQRADLREKTEEKIWWTARYKEFNELIAQLEPVINWNVIKMWKMEADDIIAVACKIFTDKEIIVVSSDRDLEMLCIYPNVKIFSPLQNKKTKVAKYKDVPNPTGVLASKINKDISDNLLHAPTSEREFAIRNKIVNLIELPEEIERPLKEVLLNLPLKNLSISKIPFASVRKELEKLYK